MTRAKYLELLAPAGSWEAMTAAVYAGADGVYLAGKSFGARQYADNFDRDELQRAVLFCHLHRVRLYITVNTLVDDVEVADLSDYLLFLDKIKVDGIIVQDLGVIALAKKVVPNLPLHASTQMTLTNSKGVEFAQSLGIVRSVLARELSLKEIAAATAVGNEIETFIHGALCICYSGQCLMSSMIGGRSGNRGRCAQPCRLPYNLVNAKGENVLENSDSGQYLLSPKDMNTLEILPQLIEAGVTSFKIEGRMKRPEYVAVVVDAYRRTMDSYLAGDFCVSETDKQNIEQIFNRDFTTAYLERRPGKEMMSHRRPNNRGILVGRVAKIYAGQGLADIKVEKELHLGDGLEFWVTTGGRVGSIIESMEVGNKSVTVAHPGQLAKIAIPKGVRFNDRVFRTLDSNLMQYAEQFYKDVKTKIPVCVKVVAKLGEVMQITFTDDEGNKGVGTTDFLAEKAQKHPLEESTILKQIQRLGNTEYGIQNVEYNIDAGIMVPVSEINEARRRAVEALTEARVSGFRCQVPGISGEDLGVRYQVSGVRGEHHLLTVHCDTVEKVEAALAGGAERIIFGGDAFATKIITTQNYQQVLALCRRAGKEIAFATPRIVKENQLDFFRKLFTRWEELQPDYVYINNLSLMQLVKEFPKLKIWADGSLNIFNSLAVEFWYSRGVGGVTLSQELTLQQIKAIASKTSLPLECYVQGRTEMMVSEYCTAGSFLGDLHNGACQFQCKEKLFLKDRQEAQFPVVGDQYCRMHVLNSVELSLAANVEEVLQAGVTSLRIDGRYYSVDELKQLTALYRNILEGKKTLDENLPHTTRGHYFRGVE